MIRTRFAPSPTGYLHIGSARTFIFNWLYARKEKGTMILRIDDTDVEWNTEASMQSIFDGLNWLGLDWDEQYAQSERIELHQKMAWAIFEKGFYRSSEEWLGTDGQSFLPGNYYYVGGNSKFFGAVMYRYRREDFAEPLRRHRLRRQLQGGRTGRRSTRDDPAGGHQQHAPVHGADRLGLPLQDAAAGAGARPTGVNFGLVAPLSSLRPHSSEPTVT